MSCTITEHDVVMHNWLQSDVDLFARKDGFRDFSQMREWFKSRYGLPFEGVVIYWHLVREEGGE